MSVRDDLRDGIRKAILLQEHVERLARGVEKFDHQLLDHERRLVRIETLISMAQRRQLPDD